MKIIEAKNKLLEQLEIVDENETVAQLSGEDAYGRISYTAKEIKEFIETHDERGYDMMDTVLDMHNDLVVNELFDDMHSILADVYEISEREFQLIRRDLTKRYKTLKRTLKIQ
jgi:hypothetical protein